MQSFLDFKLNLLSSFSSDPNGKGKKFSGKQKFSDQIDKEKHPCIYTVSSSLSEGQIVSVVPPLLRLETLKRNLDRKLDVVGRVQSSKLYVQWEQTCQRLEMQYVRLQTELVHRFCCYCYRFFKFILSINFWKEMYPKQEQHIRNISLTYNYADRKPHKCKSRWM